MEIPKALLVELTRSIDKRNRQFIQRDCDHNFYSKLIEQTCEQCSKPWDREQTVFEDGQKSERKWLGEWLDKYFFFNPLPTMFQSKIELLKSGKRPE